MSNWKPIETAPVSTADDPEVVMLWVSDGGTLGSGCHAFGRCYRTHDGGPVRAAAIGFYGDWKISHWQSLPAPPSPQESE